MADILLTVGISIESLKAARTQIGAELKSWKFPAAEKISPIDNKQLADSKKFASELKKEFSQLGTAIGKGDIKNISEAYKPIEEVGSAASFSSVNLRKLAETSKFYDLQAKTQGRTLAGVKSELSTYNRALASGSVTTEQVGHKIGKLTGEHKKLAAEHEKSTQQGLLSPKSLARMAVWALGWSIMYGTLRLVTNTISSVIKGWVDFEQAMARVATVTRQVGMEQKAVMNAMSFAALDYSRKTTVAATDVAKVMYHLGSAGLNASEQMQGFEHVLALTVGTLGDVDQVSRLVASSYILFGDSITHVTTISEKFQYITDVLGKIYAEHQVELAEIASAFTYVGGAAALINIKFEELVGTIGFLNDGMLKGSKAGTSLMATFVALGAKTDTLREYFGVTWDISKPIDFLGVLSQMKASIGESITSTIVFSQLMDIFGRRGARAVVQILQRWDDFRDAIKMTVTDLEGGTKKMQEIIESTVGGELTQIKNQLQAIGTTILKTFSPELIKALQNINNEWKKMDLIELSKKWGTTVINIITSIYGFMRNVVLAINILTKAAIDSLTILEKAANEFDPTGIKRLFRIIHPSVAKPSVFEGLSVEMQKTTDFLNQLPTGAKIATDAIKKFTETLDKAKEALKDLREEQKETVTFHVSPGLSTEKQITTLELMYATIEEAMYKRINLEGMTSEELNEQLELLNRIKEAIKTIKATEETYAETVGKVGSELSRNYALELLRVRGADETVIKQKELTNLVEKYVIQLNKARKEGEKGNEPLVTAIVYADILGKSFEELAIKYRGIFTPEILAEFKKGVQDITLALKEEITEFANALQGATTDFIKDLMSGTANIKDFTDSIIDAYRSAFAEQIGGMLADTGIFGGMAEAFLSPIQKAKLAFKNGILDGSKVGAKLYYDAIIAASIDAPAPGAAGAQQAGGISGLLQRAGSLLQVAGGQDVGGSLTNISSLFKSTAATKAPPLAGSAEALKGLPAAAPPVSGMAKAGAMAGTALGVAGGLYAGYQGIMAQKGVGTGMGALGGALSGAMAGAMIGSVVPVIGTLVGGIIGGVVGAIGGGIMGGKKTAAPPAEIKQQTLEIKSAIQISNKELQLVNRNLDGIKRAFEGFWMPRGAYFSERMGVEERFDLSRSRGYSG